LGLSPHRFGEQSAFDARHTKIGALKDFPQDEVSRIEPLNLEIGEQRPHLRSFSYRPRPYSSSSERKPSACDCELNRAGGRAFEPSSSRPPAVEILVVSGRGGLGGREQCAQAPMKLVAKQLSARFKRAVTQGWEDELLRPWYQSIGRDLRSQPRALDLTNSQWPRVSTTRYKAFARPELA